MSRYHETVVNFCGERLIIRTPKNTPSGVPLFLFDQVLYPCAHLMLRIVESRYLDMVCECVRTNSQFGVCLRLYGRDAIMSASALPKTGASVVPAMVGTLARIVDFNQDDDGWLNVNVVGGERFRVTRMIAGNDNNQLYGEVEGWPSKPVVAVPSEFSSLQYLLERLAPASWQSIINTCRNDAEWIGFRLAQLLMLSPEEKQRMLEVVDPIQRLAELRRLLPRFDWFDSLMRDYERAV